MVNFQQIARAWVGLNGASAPPSSTTLSPSPLVSTSPLTGAGGAWFPHPSNYSETFEVLPPVLPDANVEPACIVDFGTHDFAFSYGQPWILNYTGPPASCGTQWSKIVLNFGSYVIGRQFDRVLQIFVGGAELHRSIGDEPTKNGIWWSTSEDVTDKAFVLKEPNTAVVILDNVVDNTYTGIFHAYANIAFYGPNAFPKADVPDIVIPIASSKTSYGSFNLGNGSPAQVTLSELPRNIIRAELELRISNHQTDEFYYGNVPNTSFANPDNGIYAGGVVKELAVSIDNTIAAVDWHVPVIYTGGYNPLLWRPVVSIGSGRIPYYTMPLSHLSGLLSDGLPHNSEYTASPLQLLTDSTQVTLNVNTQTDGSLWFANGNLKLWLDSDPHHTTTTLTSSSYPNPSQKPQVTVQSFNATTFDGEYTTTLTRNAVFAGSYMTSRGPVFAQSVAHLQFKNHLVYTNQTNIVQVSHSVKSAKEYLAGFVAKFDVKDYKLDLEVGYVPLADGQSYLINSSANISLASTDSVPSTLTNFQMGNGYFGAILDPTSGKLKGVGLASTNQSLKLVSAQGCFKRSVASVGGAVVSDNLGC